MIIKNMPELLHTPKYGDTFVFDKNEGRFLYACRGGKTFLIYDSMFNSYIELKPNQKFIDSCMRGECSNKFYCFLPINVELMLIGLWAHDSLSSDILLLKFDLIQKTYSILDKVSFPNCAQPEILCDENGQFLLFCYETCKDGRMIGTEPYDLELELYITQTFTVESPKIHLQEKKETEYSRYETPEPWHLHFWNNKLWFLRHNKFPRFVSHTVPRPLKPDPSLYVQISYLDLNEEKPKETVVKQMKRMDLPDDLLGLQWSGNYLIFQSELIKFCVFDLSTLELFYIKHSINFDDPMAKERDKSNYWTCFGLKKPVYNHFNYATQFFCDKSLNLIAANKKTCELYKFPLKFPLKLVDLTWSDALNNGNIEKISSNMKSVYSRVF